MDNIGESPVAMFISMFFLSLASIFIGFIFSDLLLGFGQNF